MRSLLVVVLCAAPAVAQNWFIPDGMIGTACNVIPFGDAANGPFYNAVYQTRVTAADIGGLPNVITGLAFAACGPGVAHYDSLEIVMDHIPASQPLVSTFASNLTANAITVLSVSNYTWQVPGLLWYEVGLQNFFVFNGTDDLVIQITSVNGTAAAGMTQGSRDRVFWIGSSGPAATFGFIDNAALKMQISMLMARTSKHGAGCPGSNGTPVLVLNGSAQPGQTLSFAVGSGVPNGVALLIAGLTNAPPFPVHLASLGMPGCYLYTDLAVTLPVPLDAAGSGSVPLAIPPSALGFVFFAQYAVLDPPANTFGFTTSDYGRVLTGN